MPDTTTLQLVDAALAEGRATADSGADRDLQLLALALRDVAPVPDPDFAREMDEWAGAGFGHRETGAGEAPRVVRWLDALAGLVRTPLGLAGAGTAVAALAIAALLITTGGTTTTTDQRTSGAGDATTSVLQDPPPAAESAAPRDGAAASGGSSAPIEPTPVPSPGIAPGEQNRRVERQAQLTLAAPKNDLQSVADRIVSVTDRHDGFVARSSVTTGDQGDAGGDFELRVPTVQLQAALRDLSALADVSSRSQSGQDVTREYVTAADRLQAARAERRGLLRRLAAANSDARAQRLRDRLDANALELNGLRGSLRDVRERTSYATIAVTLKERSGGSHGGGGASGPGGTGKALDDSLGLLVGSFNWLLRALGVLIPAGILGGAAWWTARTFRRRRREAVLL
ncbi:MAG: hypothetical protein QOJ07_3511 [Thermoleophilaceae bacterium]|nr:hypothetical protein [Thermoleophilaceae bacterium]